ncbi:MAG: glutamate-5-semialdehyde dehydrogenase [Methanomassiliicoccales archaeon]
MSEIGERVMRAKMASVELADRPTEVKNRALRAMADALDRERESILETNAEDVRRGEKMVERGELSRSLLQRLRISDGKIDTMIDGIQDVIALEDPVGRTLSTVELDHGLILYQVSAPIGLIGVIFESRPDVIPQIMSLCLKSGNATVFKGGSEAGGSNRLLFDILSGAASSVEDMPREAFQLMETREEVDSILDLDQHIDLLIPRGSNRFVRQIQERTRIPVLGHTSGICHAYLDETADRERALRVCVDSKVQYPAACNSIETLLVHQGALEILDELARTYLGEGVELRCDPRSLEYLSSLDLEAGAMEEDWSTEYSDLVLSVKVVDSMEEAIDHINHYGSHHTDVVVAEDQRRARRFTSLVDSASVMVNASTRFADGYRYGMGAEVGISTNKVHARGPVGMDGLMIYKYILQGEGQTVAEYSGKEGRSFTHRRLDLEFR